VEEPSGERSEIADYPLSRGSTSVDPNPENHVQAALKAGVPQLYFNGVVNSMSNGDVMTVLERNGAPIAILNMSFTMAKSISVALGQLVATLEQMSGREIMTTLDIQRFAKENAKEKTVSEGTK
jgi:hypothetical protein